MNKLNPILIFCLFFLGITYAQNQQIIYDFDEVPQTLLLNPGADYSHDMFIGIPFLSGLSGHGGVTNLDAYDIFSDDGRSINDKIRDVLYRLENDDSFILNEKIDILHAGFRLNENDFLSFGFYQEFDFSFYYPKDLILLGYEGTSNINTPYSINGLNFKTDVIGALHIGVSHKVNENWTIGGRFKIYSGVANAQSKNNQGTFYTSLGSDNLYRHHIENVSALVQTSGIILDDYENIDQSFYLGRLFGFKNAGLGFDFGFTHKPNDQWKITASVLDVGFIKNKSEVLSYNARGSYSTEGLEIQFNPDEPIEYWDDFVDEFEADLPLDSIYTNYNSYLPIKLNSSIKFSFGQEHYEDCSKSNSDSPYRNAIGAQLFMVTRPKQDYFAGTFFYERRFGHAFTTKLTYTLDPYSFKNVGVGVSAKISSFNLYLAADNLLSLQNVAKANSASFQLGMNFIFDRKFP
ncbi:hypothetical protein KH5_03120 [Urechidicola sp. KH5]